MMRTLSLRHGSFDLPVKSESRTPFVQRFSSGLGHAINDISRQLFFSFRLIFFMHVLGISATNSGWLILEKKLVLAFTAPVCAILVDRIQIPFLSKKLGRRKSWHLCAMLLLAIFVPLFFSPCFFCQTDDSGQWRFMIHFSILNIILGFAGSLLDISHLSLIPILAKDQMEAVEMSAVRTAFTFLSGISTYLVAWVIFGLDTKDDISPHSAMDFLVLTSISVGVGVLLALIFHVGTKELATVNTATRKLSTEDKNALGLTSFHVATGLNTATEETFPPKSSCKKISNASCSNATSEPKGITSILPVQKKASSDETSRTMEDPGKSFQPCSSSITNNSNHAGVENKGFVGGEMELSPCHPADTESSDTIGMGRVQVNISADSLDTNCVPSPEIKINTKPITVSRNPESALPGILPGKTVRDWLKDPRLYMVAIIFSCAKALQNHAYTYLPLFLVYRVHFGKESIAYIPLVMLISATASSMFSKTFVGTIGNKRCFILAALFVICAGVLSYFITQTNKVMIYPTVVLLGLGFSPMLVISLSFATELIGDHKSTSGFVFGFMTLMNNAIGGPLIVIIQKLFPEGKGAPDNCEECGDYLRHVFSFVAISLATVSTLIVLLFYCTDGPQATSSSTSEDSETSN